MQEGETKYTQCIHCCQKKQASKKKETRNKKQTSSAYFELIQSTKPIKLKIKINCPKLKVVWQC